MKVEKCNNLGIQAPVPSLSYEDSIKKDGVYLFDPKTLIHDNDRGKIIYLIVIKEQQAFLYNESDGTLMCNASGGHSAFRFFPTTKKVCFELKD